MKKNIRLLIVLLGVFVQPGLTSAGNGVRLIAETPDAVVIAVDVPEPVLIPAGDDGSVVCSLDGFSSYHEPGMPAVAARTVMAAIPSGARVALTIDVHADREYASVDLAPVAVPASSSTMHDGFPGSPTGKNGNVYQRDAYFPAQPAKITATGVLRGMQYAQILLTPVQYNPAQRMLRVAHRMTLTLQLHPSDGAGAVNEPTAHGPDGGVARVFDTIRTAAVINPASRWARAQSVPAPGPAQFRTSDAMEDSPFAIRIVTSGPGIHRVTYDDIARLGVEMSGLTNSNLAIENRGREIAVYRSGTGQFQAGDYILFYAEDVQTDYSATNAYWLYQGTGDGLAMQTADATPVSGYPQPDFFSASRRIEQDLVWRRNLPDYIDGEDQWFWRLLNIFGVTTHAMTFTLRDFAADAGGFDIELYLRGLSAFNHRSQLLLNGTQIADFEWAGTAIERRTLSAISPGLFNDGVNTLTVQAVTADNPPATPDQYYVNRAHLTYAQRYTADNNRLAFGCDSAGGTAFEAGGFTGSDIMVFDVSQPERPVLLSGLEIASDAGISRVRFERVVSQDSALFAVNPGSAHTPVALIVDTPSNLRHPRSAVDYIIITHAQFAATVEQLKTIREQAGLGVEIVDIQDIYDEFSYGIKDVTAIKDFLRYAYNNWHATDHPTYAVLVGDATYDYRDNLGRASEGKADLVPTYLGYRGSLGPSVGATSSDNWFVCVDGDDPVPDMVIGRLCVKTNDELQNIIDKVTVYEGMEDEQWQLRAIFAVDEDDQDLFEDMVQPLRAGLPAGFTDISLYLSDYSDTEEATDALIADISNGALITNYIGHGSTDAWSKRGWFRTPNQNNGTTRDDVALLTNTDRYTFAVILNCLSGTFSEVVDDYSMSEEFVRQPDRGAVVCAAPSASGQPSHHKVLGTQMYEGLFNKHITAAGALLTAAKIQTYQLTNSRDVLETFILFGDPALELHVAIPEPECATDNECADDDLFCTGDPQCVNGFCRQAGNPCSGDTPVCDEAFDRCVACINDADCGNAYTCDNNVCVADCALFIKYKPPVATKLKRDKKLNLRISGGEGFDPAGFVDTGPFLQVKAPKVNIKQGFVRVRVLVPAGTAPDAYPISVGDCPGEILVQ